MRLSEYFNNIIIDIDSDERLSLFGLIKSENLSNFEIINIKNNILFVKRIKNNLEANNEHK